MTSNGPPKPQRAGLSLYANLLDPSSNGSGAPGTISKAPVLFSKTGGDQSQPDEASQKQQLSAASLRFQPTKRPQLATQKPKPKPAVQKPVPPPASGGPPIAALDATTSTAKAPVKTSLADWTADGDDDVNGFYGGEKRQRGGRKKRKKNKEETSISQNWDDIYDPSRPNSYEEYKNSEEKIAEIREWKDRLYAHRMARRMSSDSESEGGRFSQMNKRFAPPGMSFAPPTSLQRTPPPPPTPPPPVDLSDDHTGEDAYARRMRLSQMAGQIERPQSPVQQPFSPPPPPPPLSTSSEMHPALPPPPPPQSSSKTPQASISRAPVRYNLPPAPSELPKSEAELASTLEVEEAADPEEPSDAPRSLRPGQKGFAERLMSKYGWTKGSGLGANSSGIVNPLRVQVEKQKKKPDSEGGGFVGPGGMGKIIGGKKKGGTGDGSEEGKFGAMSEVIVLKGMIDGMDLDEELASGDLMQEIGEECGEKYGRVERVFIDRAFPSVPPVFVKFTSQLSALRAVNALEGRIFNGNTITAKFFDSEKFASGIYT